MGFKFQKHERKQAFWNIILKVRCFKNTSDNRPLLNFCYNFGKIMIFSGKSFKGISFIKLTPLTFLIKILSFSEILFQGISFVELNPWLVLHVLYSSLSRLTPYSPSRDQLSIYKARAAARVWKKWFSNLARLVFLIPADI